MLCVFRLQKVEAAMAALNTLDKKDLGEAKTMAKPPAGVDDVFAATMVLLANVHPNVVVQKNGKVKDKSWLADLFVFCRSLV